MRRRSVTSFIKTQPWQHRVYTFKYNKKRTFYVFGDAIDRSACGATIFKIKVQLISLVSLTSKKQKKT